MGDRATDVIFYSMTLWIYTYLRLGTLVPQGPCACFMQQGINLLRSNT